MAYFDGRGNLVLEICLPTDTDWTELERLELSVRDAAAEALYLIFSERATNPELRNFGIWPENYYEYDAPHFLEEVLAQVQRDQEDSP